MDNVTETTENCPDKNYRRNCIIKVIAFTLIFVVLFLGVSKIFSIDTDKYEYSLITSIYNEPSDSLDAVYIGSSNCYYYWNSLAAFEEYGITVMPFASGSQSITVAEYMITEAKKNHPNALFIVNINTMENDGVMDDTSMHYLLDNMPFSVNKLKITKYLTDIAGLSFSESLEYYLPIIRYHSAWDELSAANFGNSWVDYKNSATASKYLKRITDISGGYKTTDEETELTDFMYNSIIDLLDFCDNEKLNIVFVTVPQARADIEEVKQYNAINSLISSRGYQVVDLLNSIELTDLDTETDFYNSRHTNIHGSLKFTHYLAEYLVENFNFTDKRNDPEYASWSVALEKYTKKYFDKYVLDFELDAHSRDYSLLAVDDISVEMHDSSIAVAWTEVESADGYAVYKKTGNVWAPIAKTEDCIFIDNDITDGAKYYYTVVPYTENGDEILYGNYTYGGIAVSE